MKKLHSENEVLVIMGCGGGGDNWLVFLIAVGQYLLIVQWKTEAAMIGLRRQDYT